MNQFIVECSEPGWVIFLSEELENVFRHITFERAQEIGKSLAELAHELGPEFEKVWQGFGLEVPNDGGYPLSFGKREEVDKKSLKALLDQADQRGIGKFRMRGTMLLNQDGPPPETREQYVRELRDSISSVSWEEPEFFSGSDKLPASMADYRQKIISEYAGDVLRNRAKFPDTGHRWIEDSVSRIRDMLEEVNTRTEGVMEYELERLNPAELESSERIRWAALAARLGKNVEKWLQACDESLSYLYQKAAFVWKLWTECQGRGPARSLLDSRMKHIIEQAEGAYTAEGVDALRMVHEDMLDIPWKFRKLGLFSKEDKSDEDGSS